MALSIIAVGIRIDFFLIFMLSVITLNVIMVSVTALCQMLQLDMLCPYSQTLYWTGKACQEKTQKFTAVKSFVTLVSVNFFLVG